MSSALDLGPSPAKTATYTKAKSTLNTTFLIRPTPERDQLASIAAKQVKFPEFKTNIGTKLNDEKLRELVQPDSKQLAFLGKYTELQDLRSAYYSSYERFINFAKEIAATGPTKGSLYTMRDLVSDFKEAREDFISKIKQYPGIDKNHIQRITNAGLEINKHMTELIAGVKKACDYSPISTHASMPSNLRNADLRHVPAHESKSFWDRARDIDEAVLSFKQELVKVTNVRNAAQEELSSFRKENGLAYNNFFQGFRGIVAECKRRITGVYKKEAALESKVEKTSNAVRVTKVLYDQQRLKHSKDFFNKYSACSLLKQKKLHQIHCWIVSLKASSIKT